MYSLRQDALDTAQIILLDMHEELGPNRRISSVEFCRRMREEHQEFTLAQMVQFFYAFEGRAGHPPYLDLNTGKEIDYRYPHTKF